MNTIRRYALLALALSLSSGVAQARRPKQAAAPVAPRASVSLVTRDNFISLSMSTSGGIANLQTDLQVQNNSISYFSGPPPVGRGYSGPPPVGSGFGGGGFGYSGSGFGNGFRTGRSGFLSNNQLGILLRAINEARLPALSGKYRQKNLADGINEAVMLTISDEQNRDHTFTIQNYGDQAPRAYYAFTLRLRAFTALKFPEPVKPAKPVAPPGTAQPTAPQ